MLLQISQTTLSEKCKFFFSPECVIHNASFLNIQNSKCCKCKSTKYCLLYPFFLHLRNARLKIVPYLHHILYKLKLYDSMQLVCLGPWASIKMWHVGSERCNKIAGCTMGGCINMCHGRKGAEKESGIRN